MNIRIFSEKREIEWSYFKFSAGEIQVKVLADKLEDEGPISIVCKEYSSDGLITCLLLRNALVEVSDLIFPLFQLTLPYFPYSRQDRVCAKGEANSFSVIADILYWEFDTVATIDLHNPDAHIAVKNLYLLELSCSGYENLHRLFHDQEFHIVCPDEGAVERTDKFAQFFKHYFNTDSQKNIIQADKIRDPATGTLWGFSYEGDVRGKNLLIVDDICDGGGTFIGLARKLYEGGANTVELFVTHGIFSKGVDLLIDGGINHIYTTDTFYPLVSTRKRVTVLPIIQENFYTR